MRHVYTSGRDYQPGAFWNSRLPSNVVYARVLVVADDVDQADHLLHGRGLGRYAESLREADLAVDSPAEAILEHANRTVPGGEPVAYVIYRCDTDQTGEHLWRLRVYVAQLLDSGPGAVERVRVVSMGRPTEPGPVTRVVVDDGLDDEVPIPENREGPTPMALVDPAVRYPTGQLGTATRLIDERLPLELAHAGDSLAVILAELGRLRLSTDPREATERMSAALMGVVQALVRAHADALFVETTLRNNT